MIRIKTRASYVFFYPPLGWHALASMIILIYLIFDDLNFVFASVWSQKQLALVCTTPKYRISMSKQSHGVHHFRVRSMPGKRISPLGVTAFQKFLKILQKISVLQPSSSREMLLQTQMVICMRDVWTFVSSKYDSQKYTSHPGTPKICCLHQRNRLAPPCRGKDFCFFIRGWTRTEFNSVNSLL